MRTFNLGVIVWLCATVTGAQTPPASSPRLPGPAVTAIAGQQPERPAPAPQPEPFTYESGGRRDPFVSLLGRGPEVRAAVRSGAGSTGLLVADISVRGIVQTRGVLIAMVLAPDGKTYLVHQGDTFADGTVKTITAQGLVIVQQVKDPMSLVKQREIHKQLRSVEDAKP